MFVCKHNLVIMCKVRGVVMHCVALVSHKGFGAIVDFFLILLLCCCCCRRRCQQLIRQFVPTKRKGR